MFSNVELEVFLQKKNCSEEDHHAERQVIKLSCWTIKNIRWFRFYISQPSWNFLYRVYIDSKGRIVAYLRIWNFQYSWILSFYLNFSDGWWKLWTSLLHFIKLLTKKISGTVAQIPANAFRECLLCQSATPVQKSTFAEVNLVRIGLRMGNWAKIEGVNRNHL